MDDFNKPVQQVLTPIIKSFQVLFGLSDKQVSYLKGQTPDESKYVPGATFEERLSKLYVGSIELSQDRISKYRDFDRMDVASTECGVALDIYAEEAAQKDSKTGLRVWIDSPEDVVASELNAMIQRIKLETKAYGVYRNLAKYGDVPLYLLLGAYGVHDTQFIHPARVERIQTTSLLGFKAPELASLLPTDNKGIFKPWEFIHFRLLAYDQESVYGKSMLDNVRKAWKSFSMLECLDEETEILTKDGWIYFKDLQEGTEVATRNPDTKQFEWQVPTEIVARPHDGDMIKLSSKSVDLLVTPNHRILLNSKPACATVGPIEPQANGEYVVRAEELLGNTSRAVGIPTTSEWTGTPIGEKVFPNIPNDVVSVRDGKTMSFQTKGAPERRISGDNFCALMGMYLSEGCINNGSRKKGRSSGLRIAQQVDSKGYETFKATLNAINNGEDVSHDGHAFHLNWGAVVPYFMQFGKAADKFIPDEIMDATKEQLTIFFDHFVLGDGHFRKYKNCAREKSVNISTVSKRMAGQFVEIAQKLGWSASVNTRKAYSKEYVNKKGQTRIMTCKESYLVSIKYSKANSFAAEKVSYNGMVYCVKVPNTIVYVRRNGKSAWTGNTMIILYRIARTVQRNIFYVDVGQASVEETHQLVADYKKFLKNKNYFTDPKTNEFKVDFDPAMFLQDIIWPVRAGSLSKVEPLQNSPNIGPLEDYEQLKDKIRTGLGIPKEYLEGVQTGGWNSKESLMLQDVRFSKKIQKLQEAFREGVVKLCQLHWSIVHGEFLDPQRFQVQLGTISETAERQREDVLLRKSQILEILAGVANTLGWNRWVWGDYLLDEIFPLPAETRAKLCTPDPVLNMEFEKEKELAVADGGDKGKVKTADGIKAKKPNKHVTADSLKFGLRTFGYGEAKVDDPLDPNSELLEEFRQKQEELQELYPNVRPGDLIENVLNGFNKKEMAEVIAYRDNYKDRYIDEYTPQESWSKKIENVFEIIDPESKSPDYYLTEAEEFLQKAYNNTETIEGTIVEEVNKTID